MIRVSITLAVLGVLNASVATAGVDLLSSTGSANVQVISEGTGQLTTGSLTLDSSPTGVTQINPGTRFSSYIIKIDDYYSSTPTDYTANFAANGPIIGIQTEIGPLHDGRNTLRENGFAAETPSGRIEDNDTVTLNGDSLSVTGKVGGARGVDPIRVFVEATAVPEIASAAVWSVLAVGGVLGFGRNRNR